MLVAVHNAGVDLFFQNRFAEVCVCVATLMAGAGRETDTHSSGLSG